MGFLRKLFGQKPTEERSTVNKPPDSPMPESKPPENKSSDSHPPPEENPEDYIPTLIHALGMPDKRLLATKLLIRIGKPSVNPLIQVIRQRSGSNSDFNSKCASAITALGFIGDEAALEPLVDVLEDRYMFLVGSAADALAEIGNRKSLEPLQRALARVTGLERSVPTSDLTQYLYAGGRIKKAIDKLTQSTTEIETKVDEPSSISGSCELCGEHYDSGQGYTVPITAAFSTAFRFLVSSATDSGNVAVRRKLLEQVRQSGNPRGGMETPREVCAECVRILR